MIERIHCDRCSILVGARDTDSGEEEFYPGVQHDEDKHWCEHCFPLRGTFPDLEDIIDMDSLEDI